MGYKTQKTKTVNKEKSYAQNSVNKNMNSLTSNKGLNEESDVNNRDIIKVLVQTDPQGNPPPCEITNRKVRMYSYPRV